MEWIEKMGMVPVVVVQDEELAVPTAWAWTADLTSRKSHCVHAQGISAIKRVKQACPNMLVGAGTVLLVEKAQETASVGAGFIVALG